MFGSRKANAREWTTFQLYTDGHTRDVKTYEVLLGDVRRIRVGWKKKTSVAWNEKQRTAKPMETIGDIVTTHALDLPR